MTAAVDREGWGFPGLGRRWHYFRGSESLCGKWMFTGPLEPDQGGKSSEDCAACRRALDKEKAS